MGKAENLTSLRAHRAGDASVPSAASSELPCHREPDQTSDHDQNDDHEQDGLTDARKEAPGLELGGEKAGLSRND